MAFLCPSRLGRNKLRRGFHSSMMGRITGSDSIGDIYAEIDDRDSRRILLNNFKSCAPEELTVKQGQKVQILYREGDWAYVISDDKKGGFVPFTYCAKLGQTPSKTSKRENASRKVRDSLDSDRKISMESAEGQFSSEEYADDSFISSDWSNDSVIEIEQSHELLKQDNERNDLIGSYFNSYEQERLPKFLEIFQNQQIENDNLAIKSDNHAVTTSDAFRATSRGQNYTGVGQVGTADAEHNHITEAESKYPSVEMPLKSSPCDKFLVLYDYKSSGADDISIAADDYVYVIDTQDSDWFWVQTVDGSLGYVPSTYLVNVTGYSAGTSTSQTVASKSTASTMNTLPVHHTLDSISDHMHNISNNNHSCNKPTERTSLARQDATLIETTAHVTSGTGDKDDEYNKTSNKYRTTNANEDHIHSNTKAPVDPSRNTTKSKPENQSKKQSHHNSQTYRVRHRTTSENGHYTLHDSGNSSSKSHAKGHAFHHSSLSDLSNIHHACTHEKRSSTKMAKSDQMKNNSNEMNHKKSSNHSDAIPLSQTSDTKNSPRKPPRGKRKHPKDSVKSTRKSGSFGNVHHHVIDKAEDTTRQQSDQYPSPTKTDKTLRADSQMNKIECSQSNQRCRANQQNESNEQNLNRGTFQSNKAHILVRRNISENHSHTSQQSACSEIQMEYPDQVLHKRPSSTPPFKSSYEYEQVKDDYFDEFFYAEPGPKSKPENKGEVINVAEILKIRDSAKNHRILSGKEDVKDTVWAQKGIYTHLFNMHNIPNIKQYIASLPSTRIGNDCNNDRLKHSNMETSNNMNAKSGVNTDHYKDNTKPKQTHKTQDSNTKRTCSSEDKKPSCNLNKRDWSFGYPRKNKEQHTSCNENGYSKTETENRNDEMSTEINDFSESLCLENDDQAFLELLNQTDNLLDKSEKLLSKRKQKRDKVLTENTNGIEHFRGNKNSPSESTNTTSSSNIKESVNCNDHKHLRVENDTNQIPIDITYSKEIKRNNQSHRKLASSIHHEPANSQDSETIGNTQVCSNNVTNVTNTQTDIENKNIEFLNTADKCNYYLENQVLNDNGFSVSISAQCQTKNDDSNSNATYGINETKTYKDLSIKNTSNCAAMNINGSRSRSSSRSNLSSRQSSTTEFDHHRNGTSSINGKVDYCDVRGITEFVSQYDYEPDSKDTLPLYQGEIIHIGLDGQDDEHWYWAYSPRFKKYGYVPKIYVKIPLVTII